MGIATNKRERLFGVSSLVKNLCRQSYGQGAMGQLVSQPKGFSKRSSLDNLISEQKLGRKDIRQLAAKAGNPKSKGSQLVKGEGSLKSSREEIVAQSAKRLGLNFKMS